VGGGLGALLASVHDHECHAKGCVNTARLIQIQIASCIFNGTLGYTLLACNMLVQLVALSTKKITIIVCIPFLGAWHASLKPHLCLSLSSRAEF
jgi:hypothetical protein